MINYQRSGTLADALYMPNLLPPELRQSHNQAAQEFIKDAKLLKEKLDKARLDKVDNSEAVFGQDNS